MKLTFSLFVLLLANFVWSSKVGAQEYNLRTVPSTPQAGAPFVAAFDSTDCEAWVLPPIGEPPVVTVQGPTVRLEVDRITIANCSFEPRTNTVSVPALPEGVYQLDLIARAFQSPGNDIPAQAVGFQVGPAFVASTFSIPANGRWGLGVLVGALMALGVLVHRRLLSD